MAKNIDLPLSGLADGAVQEKLDYELQKIFNNIHDPNTPAKAKRSVTIKLEFEPDENRQTIKVASDYKTKLADVDGISTTVLTGKDMHTGKIEARELKSNMPGQTYFDGEEQKTDVGDPVDVIEKEEKRRNIINLQERGNQ